MQEIAHLRMLEVPIATSWTELGTLPAMLVQLDSLFRSGEIEAAEWKMLDAKKNAGKR